MGWPATITFRSPANTSPSVSAVSTRSVHWSSWPADYDDKLQQALASGYRIGQQGDSPRGRFVYLWEEGHPGTVIEMADMTPARERIFDGIREAAIDWNGQDPIRDVWPA